MEALSATYQGRDIPGGVGAENDPAFAEKVRAMQTSHFNDFLMPLYQGPAFNAGRYGTACGAVCKEVGKILT